MNEPLVLVSGLPGTGKTRLAIEISKRLHLPFLAEDRFQSQLRLQGLVGRDIPAGSELLFDQTDSQCSSRIGIILDPVFPRDGFRRRAWALAESFDAQFKSILCFCPDEELLRKRISDRE